MPPEFDGVAEGRDAELCQQLLGQRAGRDAGRRLAGSARSRMPRIAAQVLDRAGQIAMPGSWAIEIFEPLKLVVLVRDQQGDRAAERLPLPDAAENFDVVGFDPLTAATAVAPLAAPQLDVDRLGLDRHAGRKPLDQGQQSLAVRFSSGPIAQHGLQHSASGANQRGWPDNTTENTHFNWGSPDANRAGPRPW